MVKGSPPAAQTNSASLRAVITPAYLVAEVFSAKRAKMAMRGRDEELTMKSFDLKKK
jgi:hypothetical protein